jgi:23S rRNA-/tRNA-specific pseudouridylate synthase
MSSTCTKLSPQVLGIRGFTWAITMEAASMPARVMSPDTGRRHQLRRHAALACHPLARDRRYGSVRAIRFLAQHAGFTRLALHAHRLPLRVPEDPLPLTLVSTGLPRDMQRLLAQDR